MGCCGSKQTTVSLEPKKGSKLYLAQRMKKTPSGHNIDEKVTKKPMTKLEAEKILRDPQTPEDFKLVFGPPFNVCNRLTPYLYLTGIGGLTKENIENLKINLIINATYEWPNVCPEGVTAIRVPVDDGVLDDLSIYFDEISDKIEECARSGGKTIVHCMAGASRSTSIVLAYLIKYERISLRNAFTSVKKRRETARPNIAFWEQLIRYEVKVKGRASVRMNTLPVNGETVTVPDFYEKDYPELHNWEVEKQVKARKEKLKDPNVKSKSEKQFNERTLTWE